jgi:putative membrane protein
VLFNALLQRRPHPWRDRVMLLLFGIFHLLGIPRRAAKEAGHA